MYTYTRFTRIHIECVSLFVFSYVSMCLYVSIHCICEVDFSISFTLIHYRTSPSSALPPVVPLSPLPVCVTVFIYFFSILSCVYIFLSLLFVLFFSRLRNSLCYFSLFPLMFIFLCSHRHFILILLLLPRSFRMCNAPSACDVIRYNTIRCKANIHCTTSNAYSNSKNNEQNERIHFLYRIVYILYCLFCNF